MGKPVAKKGDQVVGLDTHIVLVSSPGGPVPTSMPMPFAGPLSQSLAESVRIGGQPAAVVGSVAMNQAPHIPIGGTFQNPPANKATISAGSDTVLIEHKKVARASDTATCCNDPNDKDTGNIVASGTDVIAG